MMPPSVTPNMPPDVPPLGVTENGTSVTAYVAPPRFVSPILVRVTRFGLYHPVGGGVGETWRIWQTAESLAIR